MRKIDKKLKDFVRDCARKAAWNIGVSHYEIDVLYMKDLKESTSDGGGEVAGEMRTDRRYMTGTLRIYPCVEKMWKEGDKKGVRHVVHHEVAHLATQHLYTMATAIYKDSGEMDDAWETLTEVVGRMSVAIDKLEYKK